MSYYLDHSHVTHMRAQFRSGNSPQRYGSVVGVVEAGTEHPITGRSGDHLQFYLSVGNGQGYQVDVNTQPETGTEIGVFIAEQDLPHAGSNPDEPFGPPAYGVFTQGTELSYAAIGLTDEDFQPLSAARIESQLEADLGASSFVTAYGMIFDDGGANGKGIHETHFTGHPNQDGALAIYAVDARTNTATRIWYYFKFQEDSLHGHG